MSTRVSSAPPPRAAAPPPRPTPLQQLSHANLRRLTEALPRLYAPVSEEALPGRFIEVVSSLIPGAMHGCTRVDRRNGQHRTVQLSPAPTRPEAAVATFSQFWHEFPLREHRELTGSGAALAVSDLISRAGFRRLELFHAYYQPLGLEDDLSINVWDAHWKLCVCVLRERRNFAAQDRLLFEALRPHILQAHQNAAACPQPAASLLDEAAVEQFESAAQRWVIELNPAGRIRFWTPASRQKLAEYEPLPRESPTASGQALPPRLQQWMRHAGSALLESDTIRPLTLHRIDATDCPRTLRISLHRDPTRRRTILVLEEESAFAEPASTVARELTADDLRSSLGLSPREAEVLLWVAQGKTNPEVAIILGIHPYTVRTHLEHIFAKLGVASRHAATLCALESVGRGGRGRGDT